VGSLPAPRCTKDRHLTSVLHSIPSATWHLGHEPGRQPAVPGPHRALATSTLSDTNSYASAGFLSTTKVVLSAPLPRVYEETGGGKVVPVTSSQSAVGSVLSQIGGTDFNGEELAKISKDTGKKLESEVLAPMERWMNAFNLVHNRMKKLEALRLEVDSRRRTVAKLGRKVRRRGQGVVCGFCMHLRGFG
jgi:hypothetical protein